MTKCLRGKRPGFLSPHEICVLLICLFKRGLIRRDHWGTDQNCPNIELYTKFEVSRCIALSSAGWLFHKIRTRAYWEQQQSGRSSTLKMTWRWSLCMNKKESGPRQQRSLKRRVKYLWTLVCLEGEEKERSSSLWTSWSSWTFWIHWTKMIYNLLSFSTAETGEDVMLRSSIAKSVCKGMATWLWSRIHLSFSFFSFPAVTCEDLQRSEDSQVSVFLLNWRVLSLDWNCGKSESQTWQTEGLLESRSTPRCSLPRRTHHSTTGQVCHMDTSSSLNIMTRNPTQRFASWWLALLVTFLGN